MEKIFREFIYIFSVINVFFIFNTVVEYKRNAQISKKRNIMVQLFMILVTYILVREIKIWEIYVGSGFLTYRKMVFRNFLVNLLSIGAFRGTRVVIWIFNILFLILLAKVYKKEYNISCIKSAFLFVMTTKYLSLICDIIIPRILFIIWKKDSLSSDMVTKLSLQEWNWFDFSVILIAFLVFLFMLGIVKIIKKLVNNNRVYVYGINILLMNVIILFVLEFLNVISIGKIGFIYGELLTSERYLLQIQVLPDLIFLNLIMTIYLVIMIKKENDERAKQDLMNSKLKLQEEYYSSLEESQMQVRKLYHDMKNHLENISNLNQNSEESRQYIDELKDQLNNSNDVKSTGNAIVDIILNEKKKVCIKEGINFETNVNSKDLSFMKNADISNIFSNVLNNAIEACQKIENREKYIKLEAYKIKRYYVIYCENSKINKIKRAGSRFITEKKDDFVHGIGIRSIETSAKAYDGDVVIDYDDDKFMIKILIPLN